MDIHEFAEQEEGGQRTGGRGQQWKLEGKRYEKEGKRLALQSKTHCALVRCRRHSGL